MFRTSVITFPLMGEGEIHPPTHSPNARSFSFDLALIKSFWEEHVWRRKEPQASQVCPNLDGLRPF
jgi:hypothetical protein